MTDPVTDDDPIVLYIARHPDLLRLLLAEHVDDGTGHCRMCTVSAQAGYLTWPCGVSNYVTRACHVRPPDALAQGGSAPAHVVTS